MRPARRLEKLPKYLFADLEEKADRLQKEGVDLIDLGIADPDLTPPSFLVDAIKQHLTDKGAHRYPTSRGDENVRQAVAAWFKGRFDVQLDPAREVVILIGGKGGLADIARAVVNSDDVVAAPEPGYPVYNGAAAVLNDAIARPLPLREQFGFLPDLHLAEGSKLLYLNYPNNPTGVVAPESFYQKAADFADSHEDTLVVWDAAYTELAFDDYFPPSILNYTRKAVEVHSLSKMMNATGYRIGFAVGNADALDQLVRVKTQVDSGAPVFIQRAMADALMQYDGKRPPEEVARSRAEYGRRKRRLEEGLKTVPGIEKVYPSPATFFIWAKVYDDMAFVEAALEKGVIFTPGRGFGASGEGYVRAAVTAPLVRIEQALQRLTGTASSTPMPVSDASEETAASEAGDGIEEDELKRDFVSLKEAYPSHPLSSLIDDEEDEDEDSDSPAENSRDDKDDDSESPDDPEQLESTILSDPEDRPIGEIIPEEVETYDSEDESGETADGDEVVSDYAGNDLVEETAADTRTDSPAGESADSEASGTTVSGDAEEMSDKNEDSDEDRQSSEDIMGALEAFDEALEDDDLFDPEDEADAEDTKE